MTVNLDSSAALDDVHELIHENKIAFPVLYDGRSRKEGNVQANEWGGIRGIPRDILIDPQGNIVTDTLHGSRLRPGLDFILNRPGHYLPIGIRKSHCANSDGSVTIHLELTNPRHTPLKIKLDYWYSCTVWADDDPGHQKEPVNSIAAGIDIQHIEVPVDDMGEAVYEVNIPPQKDAYQFDYNLNVMLPETEALLDGQGLWVWSSGMLRLDE